jgi:hypothetical protein
MRRLDQDGKLRLLIHGLILSIHASTLLTLGVFLVYFESAPPQTMSGSRNLLVGAEQKVFFGIPEELIRKAITEGFEKACPDGRGGERPTTDHLAVYDFPSQRVFCLPSRMGESAFLSATKQTIRQIEHRVATVAFWLFDR